MRVPGYACAARLAVSTPSPSKRCHTRRSRTLRRFPRPSIPGPRAHRRPDPVSARRRSRTRTFVPTVTVLPLQSTGISVQAETGNGDSHTSETGTLTVNSTNGTKCECPRFTSLLLLMRTPGTRSEQPDSSPVLTIRSWSIARMTVARRRSSTHRPPYTGS